MDGRTKSGLTYFQQRRQQLPPRIEEQAEETAAYGYGYGYGYGYELNAIAVLTNQPARQLTRIHRTDLPAVPRTHYPSQKPADFGQYLEATRQLFEQYQANRRSRTDCPLAAAIGDPDEQPEAPDEPSSQHTFSLDSSTMAERLRALDATRSEFGLDSVTTAQAVEPKSQGIDDIPTVFFEPTFDLTDPTTFEIATQTILGPQSAHSTLFSSSAHSAMQETLSGYLDTVETYLTLEITRRSPAFFKALGRLEELYGETQACIDRIRSLREELRSIARAQWMPGLELIGLRRLRDNIAEVLELVEDLWAAHQTLPTVRELMASGDTVGALSLVLGIKKLADDAGAASRILSKRVAETRHDVMERAVAELGSVVLGDMREFVEDGMQGETQAEIYQANLAMQLSPLVLGLQTAGGLQDGLKRYGERALEETSAMLDNLYPEGFPRSSSTTGEFNDGQQQSQLAAAIRSLTFDQFLTVHSRQQRFLWLVAQHQHVLQQVLANIAADDSTRLSDQDQDQLLDQLLDLAHIRSSKWLNHRSEQNSRLSLNAFHALYRSTDGFIRQFETLSGRTWFGMRGTLVSQCKAFLVHFHLEKTRQLQVLIENEQWVQAEVPVDFQHLVDQLTERQHVADSSRMMVGGGGFHLVGCSLVLVKSVAEYLECARGMPVLAVDVLQKLVELLKMFNSRTCQVVLGAGAMRSAGLKNISAKHLALASESLSLCMELVPYLRQNLQSSLPEPQHRLLEQLDRALGDFANHREELYGKLVSIMTDRADHHTRQLAAVDWDATDKVPVAAIEALAKEIKKLHKVLARYLSSQTVRRVFQQIFQMYETKLTESYQRLCLHTGEGKRHLMANSQYLLDKLRALEVPHEWDLEVTVNNLDLVAVRP